jgi:hypothetical protein
LRVHVVHMNEFKWFKDILDMLMSIWIREGIP